MSDAPTAESRTLRRMRLTDRRAVCESSRASVRGAGVKAASPATAGAEQSDAPLRRGAHTHAVGLTMAPASQHLVVGGSPAFRSPSSPTLVLKGQSV